MEIIWLTKLILAHLLADFILQPKSWVEDRYARHFASPHLYVHTFIVGALSCALIGLEYWLVALIILVTHTLIDGWKSKQPDTGRYFLIDQFLHLLVIVACWWFTFYDASDLRLNLQSLATNERLWIKVTAFIFITWPAGIIIGQLTRKWRQNIEDAEKSAYLKSQKAAGGIDLAEPLDLGTLADAGKWIGMLERCIILVLVLENQYGAIGLLIAAKGIIRFNDTRQQERKTEYLLIGTLVSITTAIVTGLLVIYLFKRL